MQLKLCSQVEFSASESFLEEDIPEAHSYNEAHDLMGLTGSQTSLVVCRRLLIDLVMLVLSLKVRMKDVQSKAEVVTASPRGVMARVEAHQHA